jgi:hypothetical protein
LSHLAHALTNLVFLSDLDRASQEDKEPPKQQSCLDVWNVTEKSKKTADVDAVTPSVAPAAISKAQERSLDETIS